MTGDAVARALILYWSLTGTTRRVAESVAQGLRDKAVECDLHDLREALACELSGYDILGIGFPVHWFRPPTPVSDAIARLGPLGGRHVFAFSLNGTYRGAGLNRVRAALVRAGGRELGAFGCHGEGSFYPYARRGAMFSPDHPTAVELEAAREFGRDVARAHHALEQGAPVPAAPPLDPPTHPMYALERLVSGPRLTRLLYSRAFRVDADRCSRCGRCAKECPVGNIDWERGALPSWGRECVLCLQCVATCPHEAVTCPMDWAIFAPFIRWNVKRALRDPDLEHAAVRFERGKFIRM